MKLCPRSLNKLIKIKLSALINRYSIICLILLFVYVGTWPLWTSKIDWGYGIERKHFLSNETVKVYYYHNGYIIQWLEALEAKFKKAPSSSSTFVPNTTSWVDREKLASFASKIYYPLENFGNQSKDQSIRLYYLTNAENIRKFNRLSENEKRKQFNLLSEYHGKLFYLDNSSSRNGLISYQDIEKALYRKYETIPFRFFINSNTELKTGCCGQSGDGFDEYCYNSKTYDEMMQEALNFVSWYNHYSLANPAIKMIESKRY